MWFLVSVVKGSKYYESDSQIDNRIMISDTTDMVVTGYATGTSGYRFEMRKGNEAFTLQDHPRECPRKLSLPTFSNLPPSWRPRALSVCHRRSLTGRSTGGATAGHLAREALLAYPAPRGQGALPRHPGYLYVRRL
jgi:hypothetical protein